MFSAVIYYLLSASAVLFYGIGINKSISHVDSFSSSLLTCIKSLFSAGSTAAVSYLLVNWLLVPIQLAELFPFVATLLFIFFSTLVEIFVGIGVRQSPIDFSIPLLSVFLGLNEGIGIASAVIVSCVSIISFYSVVIIFQCVRERISFFTVEKGLKSYCVLLLCLAVVITALCGFNVSWFNIYLDGGLK